MDTLKPLHGSQCVRGASSNYNSTRHTQQIYVQKEVN